MDAFARVDLPSGSTVVLIGIGGVPILVLQFACARGARVIITSSFDEKIARTRALGADDGVNDRSRPDWGVAVHELTGGLGADLVQESAGAETYPRSIAAVHHGGTVFTIGVLSGSEAKLDLRAVMNTEIPIQGNHIGPVANLRDAMAAAAAARIAPVIDPTYPVDQIAEAHAHVAGGGHFGKVTVTLDW